MKIAQQILVLLLMAIPATIAANEISVNEQDRKEAEQRCSDQKKHKLKYEECLADVISELQDYRMTVTYTPICRREGFKRPALQQCVCDKAKVDCAVYLKRLEARMAKYAAIRAKEVREECKKNNSKAVDVRKCIELNDPKGR